MYQTGKISQTTHDLFDSDIRTALTEIEKKQKDLLVSMQSKSQELINQIATLESLLTNSEIQHVVGEIEDDTYQREIDLMAASLDSAKNELSLIKQAMDQICPETVLEATSTPEHMDNPSVIDIPTADPIAENIPSESIPIVSATEEASQDTTPKETIPTEVASAEDAQSQNSLNPSEPNVEVITEPKEPEITEPTIHEPIISMETANEQPAISVAPVVFEAVPENTAELSVAPTTEIENKEIPKIQTTEETSNSTQ